ncbi:MAG: aminotransferase class I/II-fold pyridoxal phosphate-dependent enzyme [Chloroflexota bacterium]|nr:aminotransferase class I/II-fold pyridoxal phosphate-dependent enzyme [Chloroflexota bacterium]
MLKALRLHRNEMPYPPPQDVIKAVRKGLSKLNRYADPEELERLRGLLADYSGVSKRHIILSPGSDLLLREIIHTFSRGRRVVMVSPSYFRTVQAAKQFAPRRLRIRLSPPAFDLNSEILMDLLEKPSLVIIDNPNNPTGSMLLDRQAVEAIVERGETLFVIDEAYYEFSGFTLADMVADHPNLAVTRTMDKAFSLAGARVGYTIAGEAFQGALSSFSIFLSRLSLHAAMEALRNRDYVRRNVHRIIEERERLRQALDELGIHVYPSSTNFLLLRAEVPDVARRLRDAGVLVLDVSDQLPPGFIRVSIGTREENDAFLTRYAKVRQSCD